MMESETDRQNLEDLRTVAHILIKHATKDQLAWAEEVFGEPTPDEVDKSPDARLNQKIVYRQKAQEQIKKFRQGKTWWQLPKADESRVIALLQRIVARSAN